jgi:hypothetical protein
MPKTISLAAQGAPTYGRLPSDLERDDSTLESGAASQATPPTWLDDDDDDDEFQMSKFNSQMVDREEPTRIFAFDGIEAAAVAPSSPPTSPRLHNQQQQQQQQQQGHIRPPPPRTTDYKRAVFLFVFLFSTFIVGSLLGGLAMALIQHNPPPSSVPEAARTYYENQIIVDSNQRFSRIKPPTDDTIELDEKGSPNHQDGNGLMYINSQTSLSLLRSAPPLSSSNNDDQYNLYTSLVRGFDTQLNQAYCGIATVATVVNSLIHATSSSTSEDSDRPILRLDIDPTYSPYPFATQRDVLSNCTNHVVPRQSEFDSILTSPYGTTLRQVALVLKCHLKEADGWDVGYHEMDPSVIAVDEFRELLKDALSSSPFTRVLANLHRASLTQPGGGHWSPISMYDEGTDSWLILDVAKYKFPPFFVKTETLYASLATIDGCGSWDWADSKQDDLTDEMEWEEKNTVLGCIQSYRGVVIAQPQLSA